ncbi:unnamed protein product [Cuscuta epithymum]|uniref:Myricetin 7/4'-O-methyltransferase 2 n=1 Tax=Cuscuta epithymum TaxID=186058 RepID=A0AAV0FXG4_9ASTE|nr:unnamed protein product [Cuscuta epithymum]
MAISKQLPAVEGEDSGLLEAQTHIYNTLLSCLKATSLRCAVQLDIPDIIHKHQRPMTLPELVNALPINKAKAEQLGQLMRTLVLSGYFVEKKTTTPGDGDDDEGEAKYCYALAPPSVLLLKDNPFCARPILLNLLGPTFPAVTHEHITEWFLNDDPTACDTAHGMTFWDYGRREPRFSQIFNESMASNTRLVMGMVVKHLRGVFEGLESLVDVGGGNGSAAKIIATAFPELRCTVLDLPHVVQGVEKEKEKKKNLEYVGGDMFVSIPSADAVLLKWILHDWSDEECLKILRKCKESISKKGKGGKVIVIDVVVGNQKDDVLAIETQTLFDMLMMTYFKGKERSEKEWAKLFLEAGFSAYKIISPLGLKSLIEIYP